MKETNITLLEDAKVVKKSFYSGIRDIFKEHINKQSKYSSLDISSILINAISRNMYIESYVRNYNDNNDMPSGDTLFRRVKDTKGVCNNEYEKNSGSDMVSKMIDLTVIKAKLRGLLNNRVNVAIDEHDEPYYGYYNNKLVYAPYHKYRGTEKAYRFATMESVDNPRMTLSVIRKIPLDGIDLSREVELLVNHALSLGIMLNIVLMDRGYLSAKVLKTIDNIIPVKINKKAKRLMDIDMNEYNSIKYSIIRTEISSNRDNVETYLVHIVYNKNGKKYDFAFYTNIDVNKDNILGLAELYRKRWCIENGYLQKKESKEKTHSYTMYVRYFLYLFSILLYNLWILINCIRSIRGKTHLVFIDFLISLGRDIKNKDGNNRYKMINHYV